MASLFSTPTIKMDVKQDQYGASSFSGYQNEYTKAKEGLKFYKTKVDATTGKFQSKIRFLPPHPDCADKAYITTHLHNYTVYGAQNPITKKVSKRFYADLCTKKQFGKPCPVCEYIWENERYKTFNPKEKAMFPDMRYVSNILVVADAQNPENNGKVFLFEYGRFIAKMIEGALTGQFEAADGEPEPHMNPFDPENGKMFYLNYYLKDNILKTDKCKWLYTIDVPISAIKSEEEILNEMVPLTKLSVSFDNVIPYDKLKENWYNVINGKAKVVADTKEEVTDNVDTEFGKKVTEPVEQKKSNVDVDVKKVEQVRAKNVSFDAIDDDDFDPKPSQFSKPKPKTAESMFGDDDDFISQMED